MHQEGATGGRFDVAALAATLPGTAATPLADRYITDRPRAAGTFMARNAGGRDAG